MRGGKRIAWQPQPPTHQAVAAALTVATAEPQPPTPRRSSGRNCKRRAEWEVEVDAEPEPEPAVPLQAAAAPRQPRRRKKARRVVSLEEPEPEPAVPQPPTPPGLAAAAAHDAELRPAPCAGCPLYTLPGGVTVAVVSRQEHLAPALMLLRDSMPTPYIAIDLEWPSTDVPAYSHSFQGVALVQLASADTCVLVRPRRTLPGASCLRCAAWAGLPCCRAATRQGCVLQRSHCYACRCARAYWASRESCPTFCGAPRAAAACMGCLPASLQARLTATAGCSCLRTCTCRPSHAAAPATAPLNLPPSGCRDPSICFIGMHWGTQDADKMHDSFGWHHCDFHGGFVDAGTRAAAA